MSFANSSLFGECGLNTGKDPLLEQKIKEITSRAEEFLEKNKLPTWSDQIADIIRRRAASEGINFSYRAEENRDIYTFGSDKAILTKRLVGGDAGSLGGVIRVFIKKADYERFSWLRDAINTKPIKFFWE